MSFDGPAMLSGRLVLMVPASRVDDLQKLQLESNSVSDGQMGYRLHDVTASRHNSSELMNRSIDSKSKTPPPSPSGLYLCAKDARYQTTQ